MIGVTPRFGQRHGKDFRAKMTGIFQLKTFFTTKSFAYAGEACCAGLFRAKLVKSGLGLGLAILVYYFKGQSEKTQWSVAYRTGAPNENIVQNQLNIALLNVDIGIFLSPKIFSYGRIS